MRRAEHRRVEQRKASLFEQEEWGRDRLEGPLGEESEGLPVCFAESW